jgi:DNA-binding MarR family transcriptional regulator
VTHPAAELDEVIHQRTRLGIVAVLMEAKRADFKYLRDALDLTDGNLSRHLQILEEAGYVRITKRFEGKRPRTWVAVTRRGREAFAAELHALQQIADRFGGMAGDAAVVSIPTIDPAPAGAESSS